MLKRLLYLLWQPTSDRERELELRVAELELERRKLKAALQVERLRNDLLGEVCEQQRQWNIASGTTAMRIHGLPAAVPPVPNGRH